MMTTNDPTPKDTGQPSGQTLKSKWLSPRRKRFWAIVTFLLYTLFGFLVVPRLVHNNVIALLQDDLGRETSIEKIKFNPFALSMRVEGFTMQDTDGVKLASFDEFYVNFQWASVLKWAWTFSHVHLDSPYLYFERFDTGNTRIDTLLDDFARLNPAEHDSPQAEPAGKAPRLVFRDLAIRDGHVDAVDRVPATPVEMQLSPINIAIQELNTIPDLHGQQQVEIRLPNNAQLTWSGSLTLAPLESKGQLELENLQLDRLIAYLEGLLPLESVEASLSMAMQYHLRQDGNGEFMLDIDGLDMSLDDILVSGLTPVTEFVDIKSIALQDGKFRYPERSLHFGKLEVTGPQLKGWLNEDGSLSVMDLVPEVAGTVDGPAATGSDEKKLPWRLGISDFALDDGRVSLDDRSIQPNATVEFEQLQARMTGINNEHGVMMPFELRGGLGDGGSFEFDGELGVLPAFSMHANATTAGIPLSLAQAHAQQFAHIVISDGVLNSELSIDLPAGQALSLSGSLQVPGLEVGDTLRQDKLIGWAALDIDRFDLTDDTLQISKLSLEKPYGRFVIFDDMSTNVAGVIKSTSDAPAPAAEAKTMDIVIGGISVDQGSMDFADFSLPLPFATYITSLDGRISTIATNSVEPANILLEGQVDEYGLARIDGSMNMFDPVKHTGVTVEFRSLMMSSLSPYTVAFAGRRIDQGTLDLGLAYRIDTGQLHGENDIVLSDLVLGEKVDHPDATSLPLGLAVSLLKDADGVIRIDLPVEGDVNDPEFKIGGVVWQAFSGLITKLVSAPFKLLGNLIGIDSEDFGQFEFLAGRSDLTPPEMQKVARLVEALQKRPELVIEVNGASDRETDAPAMKLARLRAIVSQRLENGLGDLHDDSMMLDDEIRATVEALFAERLPDTPPQSLKPAHTAPPADDPEGKPVLDELAYAVDMWKRLLDAEVVTDEELTGLAVERATAIRDAFLATGNVKAERITIGEPTEAESEDGEWVKLELGVASG